jgi:hypothetical protein
MSCSNSTRFLRIRRELDLPCTKANEINDMLLLRTRMDKSMSSELKHDWPWPSTAGYRALSRERLHTRERTTSFTHVFLALLLHRWPPAPLQPPPPPFLSFHSSTSLTPPTGYPQLRRYPRRLSQPLSSTYDLLLHRSHHQFEADSLNLNLPQQFHFG